jgi:hypothetical protein
MNEDELAILCRAAVQLAPTATGEMMFMPGGIQTITPLNGALKDENKRALPIRVKVDAGGARELDRQRAALVAKGKRPYFDFNHEDGPASFWPAEFFWQDGPEPGIYCKGEWTATGKASVEGKEWRQFSPVFHVDNKRNDPARIVCREGAKPNMGGLVNDPAFHKISPLWAKSATFSSASREGGDAAEQDFAGAPSDDRKKNMNEQEIAALRAKIQGLETELSALKAKNNDDAAVSAKQAELRAAQSQLETDDARKEVEALKAKNGKLQEEANKRQAADAKAAVQRAVDRGAIAAKDTTTQQALEAKATEDPGFIVAVDALPGSAALRQGVTREVSAIAARQGGVAIIKDSANDTMKAFAAVVAKNAKIPLSNETHREKGKLAREAAAIFAKEIENDDVLSSMSIEDAIKAADYSDPAGAVGLLSGTLVLQRTLPLLQYEYPMLSAITTDFSDAPGLYNQAETTRIVLKPGVQTFDTSEDDAGRPKGWSTVSPAQTVNVSITLDEHVGVPIVFGQNLLASTIRNLFGEVAPQALYALGGHFINKVTALMTAANFNAYSGITVGSGETTSGSTTIVVASTATMFPGQHIAGTGIPVPTFVASITDSTHAVLSRKATASNSGLTFTLGDSKVPTVYATYAKALADFNMAALGDIKVAMNKLEVPQNDRAVLLDSAYYERLAQDPAYSAYYVAVRMPEGLTQGKLPPIRGFNPIDAPYFPSTSNRVGFAFHKAAALIKTRLPNDFSQTLGTMVPGSVSTVTAPNGLSVLLVQRVDLTGNYAEWRPEVLLGAAVGDRRCGMVLTNQ